MITASHNPKEYNGIKVVGERAEPIARDIYKPDCRKEEKINMDYKEYCSFLTRSVKTEKKIKVVVDASKR